MCRPDLYLEGYIQEQDNSDKRFHKTVFTIKQNLEAVGRKILHVFNKIENQTGSLYPPILNHLMYSSYVSYALLSVFL